MSHITPHANMTTRLPIICVALRNVTTRRLTIQPVGRKQGTLPWDIPPTVSVCSRLFRYPIDGWPTSRSTFAARRLFCPLSEWVRLNPIIVCPPRPVVLYDPDRPDPESGSRLPSRPPHLTWVDSRWGRSVYWSYSRSRVEKQSETPSTVS